MKSKHCVAVAAMLVTSCLGSTAAVAATPEIDGQVRVRQTVELAPDFDGDADANSFTVMRTRLGVRFAGSEFASAYVQLQDTRSFGEPANTLTSLEQVDLHQGYVVVKPFVASALSLKVGRQEIDYGMQRQIGSVGWSDIGRAFDGLRLAYDLGASSWLQAFALKTNETFVAGQIPAGASTGARESAFLGGYLHHGFAEGSHVEVYAFDLRLDDGDAPTDDNTGDLFTVGGTVQYTAADLGLKVYGEGAFQFGSSPDVAVEGDGQDYAGKAFVAGAEYTLPVESISSWVAFELNYASGDDDADDGELGDYQQLFPTPHAPLGYLDLVPWSNVLAYRGRVGVKPAEGWKAWVDYHVFQLAAEGGNWYGLAGPLFGGPRLTGDASFDSGLAQEIDLAIDYRVDENLSFLALVGYWMPGSWQEQATAAAAGVGDPAANPADLDAKMTFWLQTQATF